MIGGEFVLITVCLASTLATQAHCSCICDCPPSSLDQTEKFIVPSHVMDQKHHQQVHQFHQNEGVQNIPQQQVGYLGRHLRVKPMTMPKMESITVPVMEPMMEPMMNLLLEPKMESMMKPAMKLQQHRYSLFTAGTQESSKCAKKLVIEGWERHFEILMMKS